MLKTQRSASAASIESELRSGIWQCGRDPDCGGCSLIPQGWWADYRYYMANFHPLLSIVAHDPHHRLHCYHRVLMEIATIGYSFFTARLRPEWIEEQKAPWPWSPWLYTWVLPIPTPSGWTSVPFLFILLIVTIPGIVMWWIFFYLYTCMCGHIDTSRATPAQERRARRITIAGNVVGTATIITGISLFMYNFHTLAPYLRHTVKQVQERVNVTNLHLGLRSCIPDCHTEIDKQFLIFRTGLAGRLMSYLIVAPCYALALPFNPLLAWGQPDPREGYCWGDYIGLGQWRIEKQRFRNTCTLCTLRKSSDRTAYSSLDQF